MAGMGTVTGISALYISSTAGICMPTDTNGVPHHGWALHRHAHSSIHMVNTPGQHELQWYCSSMVKCIHWPVY